MNVRLRETTLVWLALVLVLPLLALSLTAGAVKAGCGCGGGDDSPSPPVTELVRVDVSPGGGGDVEVEGQLPYSYPYTRAVELGETIDLAALPADGYYFLGWGGDLSGNENPKETKITADTEVIAYFFPEEIFSDDSRLHLVFPVGTVVQNSAGEPLLGLDIAVIETPLPPPSEADIVGLPYELGPHGTTFDQPVALGFSYDPADIPPHAAEEDLVLGYYDDETAQWLELPSEVDIASYIITTFVDHLSTFAVIAPNPPPLPASFTISSLTIFPLEAEIGEEVTVSVLVANTGELWGSYVLTLTLNGNVVETPEIGIAGGDSQEVAFTTYGEEVGIYSVVVEGLDGSFMVLEPPLLPIALPRAVIWVILGLAIAALVIAAIIFPIAKIRRDYY